MGAMFSVLLLFIMERPVFLREQASKTYTVWSYFTAKTIVEIPFQFIFPILFSFIVYFACGFTREFNRFVIFVCILIADILCATSIGFLIGCLLKDLDTVISLVGKIMMPFTIFAGYVVNLNDVHIWLRWIQYLSPIRYSTEALLRNEFQNNDRYTSSQLVYNNFSYDVGLVPCICILLAFALVLRTLALISLRLTLTKVQ
jgi:ABC-type multidrug transport system permease subunit